jgi:hypothetical protein
LPAAGPDIRPDPDGKDAVAANYEYFFADVGGRGVRLPLIGRQAARIPRLYIDRTSWAIFEPILEPSTNLLWNAAFATV